MTRRWARPLSAAVAALSALAVGMPAAAAPAGDPSADRPGGGRAPADHVVLLALDGFDAEYVGRAPMPHLERLLAAYEEVGPLPGLRARLPLHQLQHLLVHAVLFGSGYGARCGAAARAALG